MYQPFKIVDLFAGPGGLAEGFSSLRDQDGRRVFEVALSIEKEPSAFATLRLRAFTRQFDTLPEEYYDYLARKLSREQLQASYPTQWEAAVKETAMLELGTDSAKAELDPVLDAIREEAHGKVILIGGPPCQAYSLVGRARNRGVAGYQPAGDQRHFLYKEYVRILQRLEPVAFVMENVKGMLSSKVSGESIISRILADLRSAGGSPDSYELLPLVQTDAVGHGGNIVRSELFGIPQKRHRVILLGLRKDVAIQSRSRSKVFLKPAGMGLVTVGTVLRAMPRLRSGLSKATDDPKTWQSTAVVAFRSAASACRSDGTWLSAVEARLQQYATTIQGMDEIAPRSSTQIAAVEGHVLANWLSDPKLKGLSNHESRGHMAADLARYAFAATFAEVVGRSPKADEFPLALAPKHRNWESGKFEDRFRVQLWDDASSTVTSHISKDGHYFIHPDPLQCRSLTVREAARLQTFPDNYFFEGNRTQQYVQVGNAVPPLLAMQIAEAVSKLLSGGSCTASTSETARAA